MAAHPKIVEQVKAEAIGKTAGLDPDFPDSLNAIKGKSLKIYRNLMGANDRWADPILISVVLIESSNAYP